MVSTLTKIWFSVWISSVNEIILWKKNMHLTHIFKCVKDSLVTYLPRPCLILSRNYLCASHKSLIFLYISDNIATIIERRKKKIPTTSLFIVHPILYWSNPSERIEGKSQIKTILNFQFCLYCRSLSLNFLNFFSPILLYTVHTVYIWIWMAEEPKQIYFLNFCEGILRASTN